ncbi:c-type cytochrome [Sphingorhabdus arenilitoris]|uniref:C-type cytochrome n=1 Tax=Sphingorhabdus arenilitoris TaxID=1490041 RepID=A0ABV8RLS2_9SPHN
MHSPAKKTACLLGGAIFAALLASCGSKPAEEPTEQIIVRQPGDAAAASVAAGPADLVAAGKAAFAACAGCHSVAADGASGAGPNLHGVAGRKAGSLTGFAYSGAMTASGIIWTPEALDRYIANPAAVMPGTSMVAGAVSDADDRAAIIAYLSSLSK